MSAISHLMLGLMQVSFAPDHNSASICALNRTSFAWPCQMIPGQGHAFNFARHFCRSHTIGPRRSLATLASRPLREIVGPRCGRHDIMHVCLNYSEQMQRKPNQEGYALLP